MKVGDVVTIYEDPLTEKKPEGKGKLQRLILDDGDRELWEIIFYPSGDNCNRWIKKVT
jgi:hypothetical protein